LPSRARVYHGTLYALQRAVCGEQPFTVNTWYARKRSEESKHSWRQNLTVKTPNVRKRSAERRQRSALLEHVDAS